MGKFGSLFKKSDDKQKPASPAPSSNPYASPSTDSYASSSTNPYAQPSPPTQHQQYQQYNSAQHRDNQRASQSSYGAASQSSYSAPSYGSSSGLPSGPRPGGLPARVNQGAGTWSSGHDSYGPPPSYSAGADDSSATHSNRTSPSVVSSSFSRATGSSQTTPTIPSQGGSPAFSSGAPSPAFGSKTATGYPSEKYGATDAIGRNRFDTAATSQRPGGYGNLDSAREELFSGYNRNQQAGPNLAQSQSPQFEAGNFADREHMTEEELEAAEVDDKKQEIIHYKKETAASSARAANMSDEGVARLFGNLENLQNQGRVLRDVQGKINQAGVSARIAKQRTDALEAYNRSMFVPAITKSRKAAWDQEAEAAEKEETEINSQNRLAAYREEVERKQAFRQPGQGLLGSNKPPVRTDMLFEDDDGTQAEADDEYNRNMERLAINTGLMNFGAKQIASELDSQEGLVNDLSQRSDMVRDKVSKQQKRIDWLNQK